MKDVLANHKNDFDPSKVKTYIKECAELAFQKGYSHFALGLNGNCLSSEHAEKEYFVKKDTKPQNCKDGIGSKTSIDVYTFGESINTTVIHSGQTTGHSREHARDLSISGHFPSLSNKISTVNLRRSSHLGTKFNHSAPTKVLFPSFTA